MVWFRAKENITGSVYALGWDVKKSSWRPDLWPIVQRIYVMVISTLSIFNAVAPKQNSLSIVFCKPYWWYADRNH